MYINRKEALKIAINAIRKLPETYENKQAIERLEGMLEDCKLTGVFWTKEKVLNVLNKWKDEHGRNPSVTNLMEPDMPSPTTIQKLFDMSSSAFLNIYYPRSEKTKRKNKYTTKTEREWVKDFVEQFNKIQPCSADDYNAKRDKTSPTWQTIARYLSLSTWRELVQKTGVNAQCLKMRRGLSETPKTFYVDSTCSSYNKLKDLFEKVYKVDLSFCEEEKKKITQIYKSIL
ncbi:MAG: hypothetical protein NC299_18440 [Lachnospiraceae bacterium]|nr:hypothetical protein [Ruminococcus sp.]MCM1277307.1 hypothetical protein [Lachnospiraceae bacterium]